MAKNNFLKITIIILEIKTNIILKEKYKKVILEAMNIKIKIKNFKKKALAKALGIVIIKISKKK